MNQQMGTVTSYITVRTDFEGYHRYKGASEIDPRLEFLEHRHRHKFYVTVTISVTHDDRELEFFLVKWDLRDFIDSRLIKGRQNDTMIESCEMIARCILDEHLIPAYGTDRSYFIVVSEDGENDGAIHYIPPATEVQP